MAVLACSLIAPLGIALQAPAGGPVAIIFPPWWSSERATLHAAAEGQIIRVGLWPTIIVVRPPAGQELPSGWWPHLNPRVLSGCGNDA